MGSGSKKSKEDKNRAVEEWKQEARSSAASKARGNFQQCRWTAAGGRSVVLAVLVSSSCPRHRKGMGGRQIFICPWKKDADGGYMYWYMYASLHVHV